MRRRLTEFAMLLLERGHALNAMPQYAYVHLERIVYESHVGKCKDGNASK